MVGACCDAIVAMMANETTAGGMTDERGWCVVVACVLVFTSDGLLTVGVT